ncbi:MAG TPA: DUF6690 family protein [Lacipirellulaceae bacterium]|nr:DUF6690 family protein [Lacipirellulaceae bacterium]
MSRLIMIAVVLGIAIGMPYMASKQLNPNASPAPPAPAATAPTEPAAATATPQPAANGAEPAKLPAPDPESLIYTSSAPLEGAQIHAVEQVFRFDLTKDWVYRTWARKSTGPTDVGLFAVRVPLVSGTHVGALAGSLTYYFNSNGEIEHISFRGRTGDATQLVNLLTRTYEFERGDAPVGEQLYQVRRGSRIQSELRTRTEPVLWSTSPHGSIAVELELARPGSKRMLPLRPPALDIPQGAAVASTPADNSSNASSGDSYFDKMRYATPQEEGQVLWKRWPN